jgi:hypothetical protein
MPLDDVNGSSGNGQPSGVFFSEQSGACRRLDGYLAAVLQRCQNHDAFELTLVDVEQRPDLAKRVGVTSVPGLGIGRCIKSHRLGALACRSFDVHFEHRRGGFHWVLA